MLVRNRVPGHAYQIVIVALSGTRFVKFCQLITYSCVPYMK